MSAPEDIPAREVIRSLAAYDSIKVWSWLTTIFGDMARAPGDELSGAVLGMLTEAVGIRPQAMRVAIHRLRKDGWIVARREGRGSHYCLTEPALAETIAASARIYAARAARPDRWHLLVTDPAVPVADDDALAISDHCAIAAGAPVPRGAEVLAFDLSAGQIPNWAIRAAVPDDRAEMFHRLSDALRPVGVLAASGADLPVLTRTTLRLLALHHWRRAVLRCPPLVEALAGDAWIGGVCRRQAADIFERFPRVPAAEMMQAADRTV